MAPGVVADLLLVVHLLFIGFVVFGGLLVLRWPVLLLAHIPALAWGIWVELQGGLCPLTPWEQRLRSAAGEQGYSGGFIEHYLTPIIYPAGYSRELGYALAALVLLVNIVVYSYCWWRRRTSKRANP